MAEEQAACASRNQDPVVHIAAVQSDWSSPSMARRQLATSGSAPLNLKASAIETSVPRISFSLHHEMRTFSSTAQHHCMHYLTPNAVAARAADGVLQLQMPELSSSESKENCWWWSWQVEHLLPSDATISRSSSVSRSLIGGPPSGVSPRTGASISVAQEAAVVNTPAT